MFDHAGFGVSDLAASKAFYLKALQPLGAAVVMEGPYGVGIGRDDKPSLWIFETTEKPAHLHRPDYHPNYYGAFVIGPDGHNFEAVCHRPQG